MTVVGIAGLGVMGTAIATRLMDTGHTVLAYETRPDARVRGTVRVDRPAVLAATDVVLLSSDTANTAEIVREVVFGPDGVLSAGMGAGAPVVVDMSGIDPDGTRQFAEQAAAAGAAWVDALLFGGAPAALTGRLTTMVGGAAEDVARATPVLDTLAQRITHIGPSGSGQLVRMVNQILTGCAFAAIAESAALVRAAGLEPEQVLGALSGDRAEALPQEFFTKFAGLDLNAAGPVGNMVEDLETAQEYARASNVPLPVTAAVSELHRRLGTAGDSDIAALNCTGRATA
ncbi:NAD(P)-dependent oxidoreductase [Saccharothrix deserti]|uniref:NAD(P)-dependent oxidoreductase n=1 Tax=Saccharothrix deserti TaxID=2593674 RepID=UPI00192E4158|nr:NAD(P)-dependent oxidoreductase [Saccharothrix deserti]